MRLKMILLAIGVIAASFVVSLKVMDWLSPRGTGPALVQLPPLPAVPRTSSIIAPVTIPLAAIRDTVDRNAPRNFAGQADNPVGQVLQNADINWTASRGLISATGAQNVLTLSTPLTGNLNITGSLAAGAKGAVGDALGGLLGGNVAKQIGSINIKALNANAEIRGNVIMTARPTLLPNWHVEPALTAQVTIGDTAVSVAGVKVNVPAQVKPLLDKAVNEQIATVQARIRNDGALEQNARRQWNSICRSIPLQGASSSLQGLWLEIKPKRAVASQPRIDGTAVTLTMGIEAETSVTSQESKPNCPFPQNLAIVPPGPGKLSIALPIDMPFTDLSRKLDEQFADKTFPEGGSGSLGVTVKHASIAASGDRLLISLLVNAQEKTGLFGFGGQATVHIWGRPFLDQAQQTLRLTDIQLAVESEAAFGLLGTAARAAMPYLQKALAERAAVDLKPFAANAQKRIGDVIADYQKNEQGVRVTAEVTSLRMADIAFDSKALRVIAEAEGSINVAVTALSGL
jgi:hypothetical protein